MKWGAMEMERQGACCEEILGHMIEGCQIVDHDWRYVYVNDAAARHARRDKGELLGRRMTEAFPGIEETAMFRKLAECMAARSAAKMTHEFSYPDGSSAWHELSFQPVPAGMFIMSLDITERKDAEEVLWESEGRFRSLFENMSEGLAHCRMVFDDGRPQDFIYLDVNTRFEQLTGLRDVIGKRVTEVIPGLRETNPELFEIYGRVASTGVPERFETYVEPLDDWYSLSVYSPEQGSFVAVFDVITQRKRAEEAREATIELLRLCNKAASSRELMRELTHHFQQLTGCEAVGVRLRDGDDFPYYETRGFSEDFVLAENSLCVKDQAGSVVRDAMGHPALDCMCGNILCGRFDPATPFFTGHGSFWSNCTTELLANTTEAERQAKTRNRCNGEGYESVALIPLRTRDETFGLFQFNDRRKGRFTAEKIALLEELVAYVAIALAKLGTDEALLESSLERKKLEAQLFQAQKMEAIGMLAGGIAHDFNNMLQVIISYASLLERKVADGKPRDYVNGIMASAARGADLTRGLLAYSRKQTLDLAPADINCVIKSVHTLLARIIGEDIELKLELGPGELVALVDANQVQQVLINLAANARDAMPFGGRLTIATCLGEIDRASVEGRGCGTPGPHVVFTVSDNGSGMDEETRAKIFEPFFTTKEVGRGTGLGLAIVYGIVTQHNGFILCSSEEGRGTSFTVYLPSAAPAGEKQEAACAGSAAGGSELILLAEDDEQVMEIASLILEAEGYRVMTAADGDEAVARYREHRGEIALVLLDAVMPKKNGKEAYDEIRRINPAAKVCFMSGYSHEVLKDRTALDGDVAVITKPILPDNFVRTIRTILDGGWIKS